MTTEEAKKLAQRITRRTRKYEDGFTTDEMKKFIEDFYPHIRLVDVLKLLNGTTAVIKDGEVLTYPVDFKFAVKEILRGEY